MTKELTFTTNALFKSVTYDQETDTWYFNFAENISFTAQTIWRLLKNKKIQWVSLDHGQQFGHPATIDLSEKMTTELAGKYLTEIKVKQDTADLLLGLTDNLQIEFFISSAGYESYNFSIDKKNHIGMGSGNIEIFDI